MKLHTVYLAYEEGPNGRNYIGKHSTNDPYDSYLGSSLDPTFHPVGKLILGVYKSAEAAVAAEIQWQKTLNVVADPSYANQAFQTSSGYDTTGRNRPKSEVRPGGLAMAGMLVWNNGEKITRAKECPGPEWKRGYIRDPFPNRGDPTGTRWWVNAFGENKRQVESPGPNWQQGRVWLEPST
jgi:hypothetical protein